MPNTPEIGTGREGFFVISERSGQIALSSELTQLLPDDAAANYILERNAHLQNTLTYLFKVASLNPYISGLDRDIAQGKLDDMTRAKNIVISQRAKESRTAYVKAAEMSFVAATGNQQLLSLGLITKREFLDMNASMYSDFLVEYSVRRHSAKAAQYRKKLEKVSEVVETIPIRPAVEDDTTSEELIDLDTVARLRSILVSSEGGFIPPTHREKNLVLSALDYIENPIFPLGHPNQYLEVVGHATKAKRKNSDIEIGRGPLSLVYEIDDYLTNALKQEALLQDLKEKVDQVPNPNTTLDAEIDGVGPDHPGFAALIRYRDLSRFVDGKTIPLFKDPLRTKENRWTDEGPGKHKQVEDQYTAETVQSKVAEYIESEAANLTVKEIKDLLARSIPDQSKRISFFINLLTNIVENKDLPKSRKAREVLAQATEAAQSILDGLQSEDAQ